MLAALAAALRAATSAVATAGRWCWRAVEWTAAVPGRLIRGLAPSGGGSVPHPTTSDPAATSAADEVRDLLAQRRRTPAPGLLPDPRRADGTDPVGEAVHRYASAKPSARAGVSLAVLSPSQLGWLLRLRPDQLDRLAAAGPAVCGRLADGQRAGVPGVEPCKRTAEPEAAETAAEESTVTRLDLTPAGVAARIRSRRGLVLAA